MGCTQCTGSKFHSHSPPATDREQEIGKAFCAGELRNIPSADKYRKRLTKWSVMVKAYKTEDAPLLQFKLEKVNLFKRRLAKGPPVEYRWRAWLAVANYKGDSGAYYIQLQYRELPEQVSGDISKDLNRTYPEHAYFASEKGRVALSQVLKAFALHNPDIGYCQGLNYVAAFLLLVSGGNENETFWFMNFLIHSYKLQGFYTSRFPSLWRMVYQFNSVLEQEAPKLSIHLKQENAYEMSWVGRWILSLYTTALPFPLVLRIWDTMLVDGAEVLIKAALHLVKHENNGLTNGDLEAISNIFEKLRTSQFHIETFIKEMRAIELEKELMDAGAKVYDQELTESARASLAGPRVTVHESAHIKTTSPADQPPSQEAVPSPIETHVERQQSGGGPGNENESDRTSDPALALRLQGNEKCPKLP